MRNPTATLTNVKSLKHNYSGEGKMGLILESYLKTGYTSAEGVSKQHFSVPRKVLSDPFNLSNWDAIAGKILEVNSLYGLTQEDIAALSPLKDKKITLFLSKLLLGTYDDLYLKTESWETIREYGIIPGQFSFKLRLTTVITNGVTIEIYPKRDVIC